MRWLFDIVRLDNCVVEGLYEGAGAHRRAHAARGAFICSHREVLQVIGVLCQAWRSRGHLRQVHGEVHRVCLPSSLWRFIGQGGSQAWPLCVHTPRIAAACSACPIAATLVFSRLLALCHNLPLALSDACCTLHRTFCLHHCPAAVLPDSAPHARWRHRRPDQGPAPPAPGGQDAARLCDGGAAAWRLPAGQVRL